MNEDQIVAHLRPKITSYQQVAAAVQNNPEAIVTLVRGGSGAGSLAALNAMTAGGQPRNAMCGRPNERQAISQVGGSQPGMAQVKLPEFTTVPERSVNWARRGGWLVVKIRAKYLTKGDVGQSGWVCFPGAPLEWAQYIPHPNPVGMNIPNAD